MVDGPTKRTMLVTDMGRGHSIHAPALFRLCGYGKENPRQPNMQSVHTASIVGLQPLWLVLKQLPGVHAGQLERVWDGSAARFNVHAQAKQKLKALLKEKEQQQQERHEARRFACLPLSEMESQRIERGVYSPEKLL